MLRRLASRIESQRVAVLLIALIAAWPLITRSDLPRHTDLELHVFRAAEFQRLLIDRPLEYPRWAPNFYYGYGYPIFNYYAPLTYYAASVFTLIPGVDIVGGMKGVLLLTFVLAGCGTYTFARRHIGSNGGVIAAAAYVGSPYLVFIDPFMRGDVAEFLALGCLPWVFLAFDRPLRSPRAIGLAALALSAIVFSHNLMALMAAVLLIGWLIWRGVFVDGVGRWPRDLLAIALATGLTTIFWLPFFAERGAIRLEVAGPGHFDFRSHFVEPGTLLQPSPALDLGATAPHFVYNLGFAQWGLALLALVALRRLAQLASRITVFFLLASCLLVFLMTPASQFLWEAVPPAALIQFPWRWLGPAAFTLAMCAGAGASAASDLYPRIAANKREWIRDDSRRFAVRLFRFVPAAMLVSLVGFALPTTYPPEWSADFGDTSPPGAIDFELSGVALGTTSTGDFLPVTVGQVPPPNSSTIESIRVGRPDRFDYASAPDARIEPIRLDDLDVEYRVATTAGFAARFFVFAFPGWQAYVDGQPVDSRPTGGDGFIAFDVPASAQSFGLRFESTPPRTVGSIASLISGLTMVVLLMRPQVSSLGAVGRPASNPQPTIPPSNRPTNQLLFTVLAFLVLKVALIDRCATCFRYTSPPGEALAATNKQTANFGSHIELLGFDLPRPEVQAGDVIPLTLYWRAAAPVPVNYQVFAHLVRPEYILWGQSDKLNPGDFPTTRWPLDKYVWDDHRIRVLPGTPPGEYTIVVGLYTLGDGRRASVVNADGTPIGDSVSLSLPVRVTRPAQPPSIDSLDMQARFDRKLEGVTLLGASIEQAVLPRPNFVRLTLFWQALIDAPSDRIVRAQMIDANGAVANVVEISPTGGAYPPPSWRAGEIVRDVYAFWLPPDFAPGKYAVRVSVGGTDMDIAQVEVTP